MRLDNLNITNDELRMKVSAKLQPFSSLCCGGSNNPYFVISRARDSTGTGDFLKVYKSPPLQNTTKATWNPLIVKVAQICNGDYFMKLKFEVYSNDGNENDKSYGSFIVTLQDLQLNAAAQKQYDLINNNKKTGGVLMIDHFLIAEMPSFMEYLRSGWAINMALAIDFTASNGGLSDPNSLHKQDATGR